MKLSRYGDQAIAVGINVLKLEDSFGLPALHDDLIIRKGKMVYSQELWYGADNSTIVVYEVR